MSEQEYDKEQLRILRNAFKAFDPEETGYIDHSDVQHILEIIGQKLDEKAIEALILEVDKGKSGRLDFSQFCRLAARFIEVEEDAAALASELKEAFRVYDKEGKGYLTVQTLRSILHELDDKISNQDLDMIIDEIDADGSGTVDFDEFMQVMTGKNYYDLAFHRRFVFEHVPAPSVPTCKPTNCYCPRHRMRLHRRIEWHFERFFQQCLQPFEFPSRVRALAAAINSATPPPLPPTPKVQQKQQAAPAPAAKKERRCSNSDCRSTGSCGGSVSGGSKAKVYNTCVTSSSSCSTTSYYRPIFRPRFPKWVPILTLYREIVQNPFRRRPRYMITHQ